MDPASISAESLRAAIEKEPRRADLHYLLGAELAQQRNYEEAAREMGHALELAPDLHPCRFQLGLLLLTLAAPDHARTVWAPLEELEAPAEFVQFKRGLEALIADDFANCIELLQLGIALNKSNPALNRDMQMVIEQARAAQQSNGAKPPQETEAAAVRTDFSLYERN